MNYNSIKVLIETVLLIDIMSHETNDKVDVKHYISMVIDSYFNKVVVGGQG